MATRVGLTGGIGSGKTTVAECFAKLGVQVIDADHIGRSFTTRGSPHFNEIMKCFGEEILTASGELNRKALGRIVFKSPPKRQLLESILHPPILAEMAKRAKADDRPYCILDVPLLAENWRHRDMERVVTVACARATRVERLRHNRDMSEADIERVMLAQASEEKRQTIADDVINNNSTIEAITPQVARLHEHYLELFANNK